MNSCLFFTVIMSVSKIYFTQDLEDLNSHCHYNTATGDVSVTCNYGNQTNITKLLQTHRFYQNQEMWKSLTVSGENKVTDFPKDYFSGVKFIEKLNFEENRLSTIPNALVHLQQVYYIHLSRNNIQSVRTINLQNSGIRSLNLSQNAISKLSTDDLAWVPSLEVIDLSRNRIHTIPDGFFNGNKLLRKILLSGNNLHYIKESFFTGLENNLNELHVDSNQISYINPKAFHFLNMLKVLDISGNIQIKSVNRLFFPLHLAYLDLQETGLQNLDYCRFEKLKYLEYINISKNYLLCTCDLFWIVRQVKKHVNLFNSDSLQYKFNLQCSDVFGYSRNITELEISCHNTKKECKQPVSFEELYQKLENSHFFVNILEGEINLHWEPVKSTAIYAYKISVQQEGESNYFYGPVIIHSVSSTYSIKSTEIQNKRFQVCLGVLTNDTHVFHTKCVFIENKSLNSVAGILAGIVFLFPCLVALFCVIHHDRKRNQKMLSLVYVKEENIKLSTESETNITCNDTNNAAMMNSGTNTQEQDNCLQKDRDVKVNMENVTSGDKQNGINKMVNPNNEHVTQDEIILRSSDLPVNYPETTVVSSNGQTNVCSPSDIDQIIDHQTVHV